VEGQHFLLLHKLSDLLPVLCYDDYEVRIPNYAVQSVLINIFVESFSLVAEALLRCFVVIYPLFNV